MELDRQAIERRDFPISRRGYETAAVDAHLRTIAAEFEGAQRLAIAAGADSSASSTAATQVQSILAAAETAASEIERHALETARNVRDAADRDAEATRADAIEKARTHVAAVAQVAAALLERVGTMDAETAALIESLRAGAGRLAVDLQTVDTSMAQLYDSAGGRSRPEPEPERARGLDNEVDAAPAAPTARAAAAVPAEPSPAPAPEPAAEAPAPQGGGDVDGARLIALNMALNGESRVDTERYLAENYQLADRVKLVDEVYAAVEG